MIAWLAAAAGLAFGQAAPGGARYENVSVSLAPPAAARRAEVVLRYQFPYSFYAVVVDRGQGTAALEKESAGESASPAQRRPLAAPAALPAAGAGWARLRATIVNEPDGSVELTLYAGDALLAKAVDDGSIGGPPIRGPGALSVRVDGAELAAADLFVTALPGADFSVAAVVPDADARAPQRFLTPARADGVNDAALFGPGAVHVDVFDLRGRKVYETAGSGLRWDGRDAGGRLVESGVYLARITKTDGGRCYQSLAVAK